MRGGGGWRERRINVLTNGLSDGHRGGTLVGVSSNYFIELLSQTNTNICFIAEVRTYIHSLEFLQTTEGGACYQSRLSEER